MAAPTLSVGLASLPLEDKDALLDGPSTIFVYTHFAPGTFGALSVTATDGDRCWRADGARRQRSRRRICCGC